MNKLHTAWLNREARERFSKDAGDLTPHELRIIHGPPACIVCDVPIEGDPDDYCIEHRGALA
jgi:hypothetical protein